MIPELEALGHRAIAVDLPCTDPAAMLDDYARTVAEAVAGIEGPVVIVGHSAGGATISLVPEHAHVDRLVYVTAFVPEPGRSIVDLAGADARETIMAVSRDDGNGCRSFDIELLASIVPPRSGRPTSHSSRPRSAPRAGRRWNSPGPAGPSPTCPAPTTCVRRTTSYRP